MRHVHGVSSILAAAVLAACGPAPRFPITPYPPQYTASPMPSPSPTAGPTFTRTPFPAQMPQPLPTASSSPTPNICNTEGDGPLVILSDDVYLSAGPTSNEMDRALQDHYPQWQDFQQTVFTGPWTAGDVFSQASYGGPNYALSSAVLLIAVGMRLDWEPPRDGNLFLRVVQAAKEMFPHYVAYYTEETVREAYPQIGNASTYSLYRFFGKDLEALEEWCSTYITMFGDPLYEGP